jgi:hypothetical protein
MRQAGTVTERPAWWAMRRAHSRKPATYRCPFCGQYLTAMSDHFVIAPENDASRRRHAHTQCVLRERAAGRMPTYDEWRRAQPREPSPPSPLRRLLARLRARS